MEQKKCKLIVSDFDATLAVGQSVSPRVLSAIKKHVDNGGFFSVATGRIKGGTLYATREITLNAPLASCHGALIFDCFTKKPLAKRFINTQISAELLDILNKRGLEVNLYADDKLYVFREYDFTKSYMSDNNLKHIVIDKNLVETVIRKKLRAQKVLVYTNAADALKLDAEFSKQFAGVLNVVRSTANFVEFNDLSANKGTAVEFIAQRLGVEKSEIMCMGDSFNDVPMFSRCGVSVAMGNALPEVQKAAMYVAPNCLDGGAAVMIEKFGM